MADRVTSITNTPVIPNETLKTILDKYGFRLEEDDHTVILYQGGTVVQRYSATGVTADTILIGAQDYLQTGRNG